MSDATRATRRLVILTEGQFGAHHAKTAFGVIRYGRDDVVAVLDSTQAGRERRRVPAGSRHPDRRDARRGARAADRRPTRCSSASRRPAASCPPSGGRRSSRRSTAGLDVLSGLHTFLGDDPEFAAAAADRTASTIVDYRRPPDRMETAVGRRHAPGKRVILTVGTDCAIGKMSVALELRKSAVAAGAVGGLRADRPDRDDDRGLGRRRRPAHQRLHPGHRRVARRAGRGAWATGSSSRARARSTTRRTRR